MAGLTELGICNCGGSIDMIVSDGKVIHDDFVKKVTFVIHIECNKCGAKSEFRDNATLYKD